MNSPMTVEDLTGLFDEYKALCENHLGYGTPQYYRNEARKAEIQSKVAFEGFAIQGIQMWGDGTARDRLVLVRVRNEQ